MTGSMLVTFCATWLVLAVLNHGMASAARVCPEGWYFHCQNNKCYKVFHDSKQFAHAEDACNSHHGNLATINNAREEALVEGLIGSDTSFFWIGLNDRANEGDFRWVSNNAKPKFTKWHPHQPDNAGHNEDCVHIYLYSDVGFAWNDLPCSHNAKFVCEIPADITV